VQGGLPLNFSRISPYVVVLLCDIAVCGAGLLDGQELLKGRVVRGDVPVTNEFVVLHSVSSMKAGQVDSVYLDKNGFFEFLLPDFDSMQTVDEVYFASVAYQGVLYFGNAITEKEQLVDLYSIPVFESKSVSSKGMSLPLKVRNVLLEMEGNTWRVRDVIAIENPGEETLVPTGDGVVWSYPLPSGFRQAELVRGELPPEDVVFTDEQILVKAPIPPGERMLVILYQLPDLSANFPAPGPTEIFEIFVKEPSPALQVSDLAPLDVVSLEPGSTYRRYSGSNLVDVNISVREVTEGKPYPLGRISLGIAILLGSVVLLSGMGYMDPYRSVEVATGTERSSLLLKLAQLDQLLESGSVLQDDSKLKRERVELLTQLKDQG